MSKIFIDKPADFIDKVHVSTVFIECSHRLLLLQRSPTSPAPLTWATPGGKLEDGEPPLQGLVREIVEELKLYAPPDELHYVTSIYVRHDLLDYKLHLFRWQIQAFPPIQLNANEHIGYCWQPIDEFDRLTFNLIEGQYEAFACLYKSKK